MSSGGYLFCGLLAAKCSGRFLPMGMFAIALCLQSGCGYSSSDIDLGKVTGTVTLDGEPLANALLTFVPDSGRSSVGTTDSAGFYRLKYTGDSEGAVLGEHKVIIESLAAVDGGFSDPSVERSNAKAVERIPRKYNAQSSLRREVTAGSNTIDFELDSR